MLVVAILAAGKGTRMKSSLPKVLQQLAGRTLIERVLAVCNGLNVNRRIVIVGHQEDKIRESLNHIEGLEFIQQSPQNGTGHALQKLLPVLKDFDGQLLVLSGDVPLLKVDTIKKLVNTHTKKSADVTLLTATQKNPKGYGRVFTTKENQVRSIIEDRDCTKEQLDNHLTNAGIYCFEWSKLKEILPNLSNKNNQGELYLTDTIKMMSLAVHTEVEDVNEVLGINNRKQLSICEALLQERLRNYWMNEGVTFTDPSSCTISESCTFGKDVLIEPQTHLRGKCKVGNSCLLGPGTLLKDVELGDRVKVLNSVIDNSKVDHDVFIGPFTHLRPQSTISSHCRIGNFVEIKKSHIGERTKVNHLSYIGDSQLGSKVNIGAGTITANYDGRNKHQTRIGDNTKTGANSVLVAPIVLGKDVTVGAGSTLTKNVPNGSLAIGRSKQLIKEGWSSKTASFP
ncbi:bifunctional UDP-N-acetylglucosamine diphosphorylase/glucosamine-1-phosphate N-acetyltransferase GlmU [Prochlorococcus sp. MIT 1300]|uniref:bifunctional UDP-N-acetylglucosamine diphosphorylase/glucosamine-1-phosphate N-acetyltransferase GlmU n=1 Tax=Prochlorococcus sp. MIT 1300 TaxID=3096218 RepID=UPI002A7621A3|nr:bifunctional UDP-N-acetylglucosamine diphosphorylase/glucosamine-1-phosphate N-acetyltransferase GlmU [Prochlorococcus sp. MIT 1300]